MILTDLINTDSFSKKKKNNNKLGSLHMFSGDTGASFIHLIYLTAELEDHYTVNEKNEYLSALQHLDPDLKTSF